MAGTGQPLIGKLVELTGQDKEIPMKRNTRTMTLLLAAVALVTGCASAPPGDGLIAAGQLESMIRIEVRPIEPEPPATLASVAALQP